METDRLQDSFSAEDDAERILGSRNRRFAAKPCGKRCCITVTMLGGVMTLVVVGILMGVAAGVALNPPETQYRLEKEPVYWRNVAHDELQETLGQRNPLGVAKNVILFLGDGMGPTTVTAARILGGQKMKGRKGEEVKLSFDKFPFTGLSRTYNVDTQVTDSAASGTAYLTGVKTNQGMLGLSAHATRADCESSHGHDVHSILQWSLEAGKSVGVVTTTRVTHATPGASYSHTPERNWEADSDMPENSKCLDIAAQLVKNNPNISVIMGGGRSNFYTTQQNDPDPSSTAKGRRINTDLIQMWKDTQTKAGLSHSFVYDKEGLDRVDLMTTDRLLGLFNNTHMAYEVDRDPSKEPSIAEMTEKAIQILRKNEKGFFLLVEGGPIDHGHHATQASRALHDVLSMADAVDIATRVTKKEDTLVVVTADHSHTMTIAGYSHRGNPILGVANPSNNTLDEMPYTTLLYGNGISYTSPRQNLTDVDTEDSNYHQQSAVPMEMETHGGEDVAIYATGPQSFLYTGVHEQNYIPIVMAYASCVGDFAEDKQNCARFHTYVTETNINVNVPPAPSQAQTQDPNFATRLEQPLLLLCLALLTPIVAKLM
ncbi:alkaline phosphatase [Aplysia californica]|uniref:Alkaline phosphatase n=1 Tax=Aplysia californica TaxID=6500 RepID=A0ABM1A0S0_APLCA|nr:alkaline phosphatase [Aplysia californica]